MIYNLAGQSDITIEQIKILISDELKVAILGNLNEEDGIIYSAYCDKFMVNKATYIENISEDFGCTRFCDTPVSEEIINFDYSKMTLEDKAIVDGFITFVKSL